MPSLTHAPLSPGICKRVSELLELARRFLSLVLRDWFVLIFQEQLKWKLQCAEMLCSETESQSQQQCQRE